MKIKDQLHLQAVDKIFATFKLHITAFSIILVWAYSISLAIPTQILLFCKYRLILPTSS